ncbi:GNAT family N-acetyltransferase [Marinomonas primoryensis]|jgi:ribosomal protein S18 acetylase RimI-like enzyme|uniref:GNAT family N-acetyltransferase n=1 Tax=Marinomonas primoryensis TaxID=178399 RepID=A0A859CYM9_9GAMM|nr:GNAT family N-acetyltransferase [Marinomonas primoryensis]QKK81292.1 GNAT family N-acetyltransferase [Marinomonas primoryensis]|tara:strand:- start:29823 stop:30275 length:453 start_codon:yes stop_codon:yes gene_type:complete
MLNFRDANFNDKPKLLALEQALIEAERPFNKLTKVDATYHDLDALISVADTLFLVVEIDGQIVATGYVQIRASKTYLQHSHHGYLGFMYVVPQCRGQGLNKKLLEKLIVWGQERGIRDFYLEVYTQNNVAIKAYEKVGFTSSVVEMKLTL